MNTDQTFEVATLSPPLQRGMDSATARINAQSFSAALEGLRSDAPALRLVLLPAGCLSGGAGVDAAWPAPGHVTPLIEVATAHGVWLAGADSFDGSTRGFLLSPAGAVEISQRPLDEVEAGAGPQVVDTPCGHVAILVGSDLLHPEYARLAMFGGAEILLNPCTERLDGRAQARLLSRGARAWENHAMVLACSAGVVLDATGRPAAAFTGQRMLGIWGFGGQLLAGGDAPSATAPADLHSLRQRRSEPWINFPAQLCTGLYAGIYAAAAGAEAQSRGPSHAEPAPPPYDVLMLQTHEAFIGGPEDRDATIADNLARAFSIARPFCMRPTTRLMVLPEFALQGSDGPHPHDYWEKVGIRIPGPETAQLAAFARECNVYVCAMVYEYNPDWPLRYFNTSIIISPAGEIILRYRKLQCSDLNGLLNITTPGSVHTRYVERYGHDALIPVVDTPIGRLGSLICFDSNWPELWRCLALKGAEVICNPTSEIHSDRRPHWYAAKRAHAAENRVYVASANAGSEQFRPGAPVTGMNRGHSALIDYDGMLASCADGPGVVPLLGRIDIGALRRARAQAAGRPGEFRASAMAAAYAAFQGFPLDYFLDKPILVAQEGPPLVRAQIERFYERGVFTRP